MRHFAVLPRSLSTRLRVLSALALLVASLATARAQTGIVISQVYGGGGNSGATYTNDFVELFNPTAAPIILADASLQYASAAGTSYAVFDLPATVTLQPGQFFLLQASAGAGGTAALPAPDASLTNANGPLAISATAGKLALVRSITPLSGTAGCPTADPGVIDYVGFGGASTTCSLGSPAPAPANATAVLRSAPCTPTGNNAADFTVAAPTPRNSAAAALTCSGSAIPTALAATGAAAAATQGAPTLLTVRIIPASTGLTVSADLSAIAGSTTQPLYDDGTNGDAAAGDGTFSYQATVAASTPAGTLSLPVTARDAQLRSATSSITLTVSAPAPTTTIRQIQSAKPSPFAGQIISTSGIVTSIKSNGFYLEAQDADQSPSTPEGVLVYTGTTPPSTVAIGQLLQLSGKVSTYPTTGKTLGTEIDSPTALTVLNSSVTLPTPIPLTAAQASSTGGITQFAKFEGMRVAIASFTTTGGTGASLNEATETNTSNGQFYGVVTGITRPFREPGLSVTEPALPSAANLCPIAAPVATCIPQWDSNPELLLVDSRATGAAAINLTSLTTLTNVVGVLDFSSGVPTLILDRATRPTVSGGLTVTPLPAQSATEFTIASFNMERFYNDLTDADNPGASVVRVTPEAYQRRLAKASLAVRNVLNSPDVIGAQEIENLAVLTDLATRISTDAKAAGQTDPLYLPYLSLASDGTGINTGMLVRSTRVTTIKAEQIGLTTTFTNSIGNQATLNDRTPLVVHLGIKRPVLPDYPITVLSVHQRSLINVDDTTSTGATVRLKREAQAEFLARLIQTYQAAGEHVVTVGDFNAFQFSDGYVDALGVTLGTPVPAAQVLTPPVAGLATPTLVDLVTTLPAAQQQSYVEAGSAQVLDHIVVTQDLARLNPRLLFAHIDSDFPLVNLNDATSPTRISDHDPAVAYFTLPQPILPPQLSLSAASLNFGAQLLGSSSSQTVTLSNRGTEVIPLASISLTGAGFAQTNTCGISVAAGSSCIVTVTFVPTALATVRGSLAINTSTPTSSISAFVLLTGSGADFTLTTTTPQAFVNSGQGTTLPFTLTSLGGFTGPVTFTCTGITTGETCTVSPTATTLAAGATSTISAVITTSPRLLPNTRHTGTVATLRGNGPHSGTRIALGSIATSLNTRTGIALSGLGLFTLAGLATRRRSRALLRRLHLSGPLSLALALTATLAGCGQGTKPNPTGTPATTQTITLTATSGTVTRTAAVRLTVN